MSTLAKKLLLTSIAALFLATGTAQADTSVKLNNKEIMGEWCYSKNGVLYRKFNEDCPDGILNIQIDYIEGSEHSCTYTGIKTWYDPTIPTATKTPTGALVSTIKMTCGGEGCAWRERVTIHLGKGYLAYKSNWMSHVKCE